MAIEFKEYSEEEKETSGVLNCKECIHLGEEFDEICKNSPCTRDERQDKKDGYYIEVHD